jgi:cysteinyl-tRNA synthetase
VIEALGDDLNFHQAALEMDDLARDANKGARSAAHGLAQWLVWLGFSPYGLLATDEDSHAEIDSAVQSRLAALTERDFAKADSIRAELLARGIQLMDYKDPATGERRTKWEVKR